MPLHPPHHIIAIGASAGGMEEINLFFDHTPLDGVSYVIVQHLSADFKSRMLELLARHSKLIVQEAVNAMPVLCNEVYLIPNDKYMTIRDGNLFLTEKENIKGPHLTINTFFNSLAADCGPKAIGVVLSGLGSDGTEGARAIKKAGGMVIVRNPAGSEFNSMPASVIATGMADFVLEPALMPAAIEDYVKSLGELLPEADDDEENLSAIIEFIKQTSPLDFSDYKQSTILRRTKRRAAYGNFTSLHNYKQFLMTSPEEVEALSKDFMISVTAFFRDKDAFSFIESSVLPKIMDNLKPDEELKIWVAGCATGEEVYTIAMLICEQLLGNNRNTIVKIFATDIDGVALAHAGKGIYSKSIERDVSPERLERHFTKEGQQYRVKPDIRRMVIFAQHDLVKNPPYCNMHLISCRNLLIYMTPVLQKKIFSMLLFGLKMDGYLFLGSSENPMPILKNLEVVHKKWKIYRNLEPTRGVNFDSFSLPDLLDIKHTPARLATGQHTKNANQLLLEAMNEHASVETKCLRICLNESLQVIKSFGDTNRFLLQKHFTNDLNELLPKPLAIALNTLSKRALKTNSRVSASGILIKHGSAVISVCLAISPLEVKNEQSLLIATFQEEHSAQLTPNNLVFDEQVYLDQYSINLEDEIKDLKDRLNASYERLDASNENMQSFNEELISANEEMQSTNEEMQSVNEELHTINTDYQLKNKELSEINDDLNNYFRSNINGQLFINNEMELMKFSPGTVNQINLQESDIGRPLSHISTNIKLDTIIDDVKKVLKEGVILTKDIETNNGKWYQCMTMPYVRQADNQNFGAIITFADITALKSVEYELNQKNKVLMRVNADLDNFIHAASHDLLAPLSNIELSIGIMNSISISDVKRNDILTMINGSVKKFRTLIKDIGTIAKVEGEMREQIPVDLDEIIDNIEWSLEDKIESSGAKITRNLQVNKIVFSKKNLRSIVYNLISNAIKFRSVAQPLIHIETKIESEYVILSVQDNGKGIPNDAVKKIFDMYGRLNQDIEGQGIGLYLAKKIVNAAGGSIVVETAPGVGSIFKIYLKIESDS
jgi:two-component system CheB/CheR fusion protein